MSAEAAKVEGHWSAAGPDTPGSLFNDGIATRVYGKPAGGAMTTKFSIQRPGPAQLVLAQSRHARLEQLEGIVKGMPRKRRSGRPP